jgi:hypothetical protein
MRMDADALRVGLRRSLATCDVNAAYTAGCEFKSGSGGPRDLNPGVPLTMVRRLASRCPSVLMKETTEAIDPDDL